MKHKIIIVLVLFLIFGCSKDNGRDTVIQEPEAQELTIFFINDQHGQLDNFSKMKHIIDLERQSTNVIVACSGDMFSGNPIVDNYLEKGYPMIDMMNEIGFDVSVLGNHEFDYGEDVLTDRMNQANFDWVCANVDMGNSGVPEPKNYSTINVNDLRVTFLGLVETNGKDGATIPSTHPWRVQNLEFERPENVITQYANIKEEENADLYIALTHIGHQAYGENLGDDKIASDYPYFDLIIGGHSHQEINTVVNNIPIFQSGSYLNNLGQIKLVIKDKEVQSFEFELIDLNNYSEYDTDLKATIDEYNDLPYLKDVIGYSHVFHSKSKVGCFYTDALKAVMNVDVTFQNTGGVRTTLNEGDITKREIFEISPFNNGTVIYEMTVSEIVQFLKESNSGFYFSGIQIEQYGNTIQIKDEFGNLLNDTTVLKLGINDYIPAVYDQLFPTVGTIQPLTAAESLINYLEDFNNQVNYPNCNQYFRFQ